MKIHAALAALLDTLFPRRCQGCSAPGWDVCPACWGAPRPHTSTPMAPHDTAWHRVAPQVHTLVWVWGYRGTWVEKALPRMKYRDSIAARSKLVQGTAVLAAPLLPQGAALVPVPQPWWRWLRRGRTIALRYAAALHAQRADMPVVHCLQRVGVPARQAKLARAQRLLAPAGTMRAVGRVPRVVVIVDDVTTTGATVAEAARVLKEAGAEQVWVCTLAH